MGDRDLVDGLAPLDQPKRRLVAPATLLGVEVRGAQEGRDLVDGLAVDQDGAR